MAIMDMFERNANAPPNVGNHLGGQSTGNQISGSTAFQPPQASAGISTTTGGGSTTQTLAGSCNPAQKPASTYSSDTKKDLNRYFHGGPSPEKGSGQDRFRQLILDTANKAASTTEGKTHTVPIEAFDGLLPYSPRHPSVIPPAFTMRPFTAAPTMGYSTPPGFGQPAMSMPPPPPAQVKVGNDPPINQSKGGDSGRKGPDAGTGSGNGNGTITPTPTALLSAECQKRRFNPQFTEYVVAGGYRCSVNINGTVLHDSRTFSSALEAKKSLAKRALGEVRKMPCPDPGLRMAEKAAKAAEREKYNSGYGGSYGHYQQGRDNNRSSGQTESRTPNHFRGHMASETYDVQGEEGALLARIRTLYGYSSGPDPRVMANPSAARAYLEGFALGANLHECSQRQDTSDSYQWRTAPDERGMARDGYFHARERSPAKEFARHHRERSPLRR